MQLTCFYCETLTPHRVYQVSSAYLACCEYCYTVRAVPLVAGGQGRSEADITATVVGWVVLGICLAVVATAAMVW